MTVNAQVAIFQEKAYERILAEMNQKDDAATKLGDTLDVKASILLAVIALLATQTAYFLDKQTLGLAHFFLVGAGISLACATISSFVELWPREYHFPVPEKSGIDRVAELHQFYSQHGNVDASVMVSEFTKDEMGWAQFRILKNEAINETKSLCLQVSFYLTAVGMTLNIITLFMRLS